MSRTHERGESSLGEGEVDGEDGEDASDDGVSVFQEGGDSGPL